MTKERKEFNEKVEELKINFVTLRYIKAMCMQYSKNVTANIYGKDKAEEQRNCMGEYNHFFYYAERTAFISTIIELSKFFDRCNTRNKTLSIYFLLEKALKIPDLNEEEQENIKNFEKKIETPEVKNALENLRNLRDKYVVHNDLDKIDFHVSDVTLDYLLEIINEILQYFFSYIDETKSFGGNNFEEDGKSGCEKVVEDLVKYNKINKLVYDIDTLVDGLRGDDKDKWKNKIKKLILKLHKELFDKDGNTVITTEKYAKLLSEI